MEKRIVAVNGDVIIDTLIDERCGACILSCVPDGYAHIVCDIDGIKKRVGYASDARGSVAACSQSTKTTRNFKQDLQYCVESISRLLSYRKEVEKDVASKQLAKIDMLVHNLKSQNAHAIQELYNFVTEDEFVKNINDSINIVIDKIKKKNRLAALLFLRLAKINSAMDDEIFIYENLIKTVTDYKLSVRYYKLRDVVMLVFHEFMEDYNKKNIYINTQEYYERVMLDFRTTRFVLYHIIGNSSKYTKSGTEIKVLFDETGNHHIVRFKMTSYYLTEEDIEHMYDEGYSGEQAKNKGTAGRGLGMYLVKRMMQLNRIQLNVIPGHDKIVYGEIEYADNIFEVLIPKDY